MISLVIPTRYDYEVIKILAGFSIRAQLTHKVAGATMHGGYKI